MQSFGAGSPDGCENCNAPGESFCLLVPNTDGELGGWTFLFILTAGFPGVPAEEAGEPGTEGVAVEASEGLLEAGPMYANSPGPGLCTGSEAKSPGHFSPTW
mmetsp:Transcript_71101/g.230077  ORF Transcript_71101/g.230077 Transcript_71101/m.230077 type:complete len:102 (-) Transcript_71101:1468-1773(-)